MPKITKIVYNKPNDRYLIYVDGSFCTKIRARTFSGMNLVTGQECTCEEIIKLENFHWKIKYGKDSWDKEEVRIDRVIAMINYFNDQLEVKVSGFGAKSNQLIEFHPSEQGKPDLEIFSDDKNKTKPIIYIEVTGTEALRGSDYWVRPDKLEYCQKHPEQNVWVILHYAKPKEKFVFIKPILKKEYQHEVETINGSKEHYVKFDDNSEEVKSSKFFYNHLMDLI